MELLAVPLGLIRCRSLGDCRYRLMDVEVIVKRGLVYVAAGGGIVGALCRALRLVGWVFVGGPGNTNHRRARDDGGRAAREARQGRRARTCSTGRSTATGTTTGAPWWDSPETSAPTSTCPARERLVTRITETLVIDRIALMVADESPTRSAPSAPRVRRRPPLLHLDSGVGARVRAGHHVALDDPARSPCGERRDRVLGASRACTT